MQFPGVQHDVRCPLGDMQHSRDAGHTKSLVAAPQHWLSRGFKHRDSIWVGSPHQSHPLGHDSPFPPHEAGVAPLMTEPLTTMAAKAQTATATAINDETGGGDRRARA